MLKCLIVLPFCSLFFLGLICVVLESSSLDVETEEGWALVKQKHCHLESIEDVGISPNEEYVFSVAESLKVWDAQLNELLFELPLRTKSASFTDDSNLIVATSYAKGSDSLTWTSCHLIDIEKKSIIFEFPKNRSPMALPAVSRDKSRVVLSTLDGKISIWSWQGAELVLVNEFNAGQQFADYAPTNLGVRNVGITEDNSKIAIWYFTSQSGSVEWEIKLFDTSTGEEIKSESKLKNDSRNLERLEARVSKDWTLGLNTQSLEFMGADDIGNYLFPYSSNGKEETWCRSGAKSRSGQLAITGLDSGQLVVWRKFSK